MLVIFIGKECHLWSGLQYRQLDGVADVSHIVCGTLVYTDSEGLDREREREREFSSLVGVKGMLLLCLDVFSLQSTIPQPSGNYKILM